MPTAFDLAFVRLIGVEGRYSNNPSDSGGETMWGVTARVARAWGYVGAMRDLPLTEAKRIAKLQFWDVLKLDVVATFAPSLAYELFDSSYNVGADRAGRWLQRALNALNLRGDLFADMRVDGLIGAVTLASFQALVHRRGQAGAETVLRRLCDCQQGTFYLELAERREKDEAFVYGWARTRLGETA